MKKIVFLSLTFFAIQTATKCVAQMMMASFKDTSELSAYMDSLYNANSFSGVVAIAKGNHFIYKHSAGTANKEEKIPVTEYTIFDVGSITKMFTAVAVMQLVEKDKITLTDAVSKYLPEYPNKAWADQATIQELLSHTSGMGEFFPHVNEFKNLYNLQEIVDTISKIVPVNMPSKEMVYSNAGFYLLGRIIEKVSGQNYFQYIQKNVFDAAGMKDTYFETHAEDKRFAKGYMLNENTRQYESNKTVINKTGGPAGGTLTNIADLLAFKTALKSNKLLSEKYCKEMTAIAVQGRMGMDYGLGIGVGTMPNGVRWIGHNGGAPGIAANFAWFIDTDYSVIVFMNQDAPTNMRFMLQSQMFAAQLQ